MRTSNAVTTAVEQWETAEQVARALMRLSWLAHKQFAQHLSQHGLTVPQYFTLLVLLRSDRRCAMRQLAEATRLDAATMTGIVDRLERLGLVERHRNPLDRRVVFVRPTEQARTLLREVRLERQRAVARMFDAFGDEEMRQLLSMLERLLAALEAVSSEQ